MKLVYYRIGVLISLVLIGLLFHSPSIGELCAFKSCFRKRRTAVDQQMKHILLFTGWANHYSYWEKVFIRHLSGRCPEYNCVLHTNQSAIRQMDAVLFNALSLPSNSSISRSYMPSRETKKQDQMWVFLSAEPPSVLLDHVFLDKYNDYFDWTMTYRKDSDVQFPFGLFLPKSHVSNQSLDSLIPNQPTVKDTVAWMVSRCKSDSKRELFVKELKKHISVDIYGQCGKECGFRNTLPFLNNGQKDQCEDIISKYYFYLALENSICKDYVTEKFFRSLKLGLVPIVFRRSDYEFAPADSFISADDFASMKEMASYLMLVMTQNSLYRRHHEWRRYFTVELGLPFNPLVCDLCSKLHSSKRAEQPYKSIRNWFVENSNCVSWSAEIITSANNTIL